MDAAGIQFQSVLITMPAKNRAALRKLSAAFLMPDLILRILLGEPLYSGDSFS